MKKLSLLVLIFLSVTATGFAQGDTLLFEDFTVDPTANYALVNNGNDTVWVNYDLDGLQDANNRPQEWFWSPGGFSTVDSVDACLFSSSWLLNFAPGNRNWLITPPIQIVDANATLSWASAPRQTPRFLDGYSILVSTTDNIESSFTTTLFQAAQFLTGNGPDFSQYTFTPGFVHGQDGTYTEFDATSDSARLIGVLRPFSESLAQFSGQTIYIAFVHDSDDDNLISIDDILVTGTLPTGMNDSPAIVELDLFPNPVSDKVELSYHLNQSLPVRAIVYDMSGKAVITTKPVLQMGGNQRLAIKTSELPAGNYSVVLETGSAKRTSSFIKQ